ncbi:branched-chain amino acid ABC transporter permease [Desulfosporosinus sp. BICA1-9]|uniref:branched-chain amino acid ABC transporter permease n=1 Tax=Desulfosporosinus sp. BICA1-9 TaxID=1531958 RepID=UPI00054C0B3F|nr:branched-chain amino acid ABC transporter permease [Desulfosporosinus sp. BICA1-9]KJS46428.1 MAG: ABC transporter permease [Peptococcaceae bacterium BRH_c23]KJS86396.1 MAG: ABC transporter permease [Desulfosporosinus sp. BICA1-9]
MFNNLMQQLVNGLALGSIYALIALGYTMVYGIIGMINFAYGEIFMFGAYAGLVLALTNYVNVYVALLGATLITMVLGVVIERVAYKPLRRSSRLSALISAIGVSIFLSSFMVRVKGPNTRGFPKLFENKIFEIGNFQITIYQIVIIGVAALLMLGLHLFVTYTKTGRSMRACSQDQDAAKLMGVNVDRVVSITFAIGSGLAGTAGVLAGIYFNAVQPYMGLLAGLKAFAAAVLGGIGSIPGAMIGGLMIGMAEIMGITVNLSEYKDAFAFTILILVLLFKPSGIMGRKANKKV